MAEKYRQLKLVVMQKDPKFNFKKMLRDSRLSNEKEGASPTRGDAVPGGGAKKRPNVNAKVNLAPTADKSEKDLQKMGQLMVEAQMRNFELE